MIKEAIVKVSGRGIPKTVLVPDDTVFPKGKKVELVYEHNAQVVGYFTAEDLLPVGSWSIDDHGKVVDKPAAEYPNGDPFSLIKPQYSQTEQPILIQLLDGQVLPAYPMTGFIEPRSGEVIHTDELLERLYLVFHSGVCQPLLHRVSDGYIAYDKDVVAWSHLPSSLV